MRQAYETLENVTAQQRVADTIARMWRVRAVALPRFYCVDYALTHSDDGEIESLMEVKCRNVSRLRYESYMLAVSKAMRIDDLVRTMRVPVYLVVQWTDALSYFEATELLAETEHFYIGGRSDRDDPADTEPVLYIPIERFTLLKGTPNGTASD